MSRAGTISTLEHRTPWSIYINSEPVTAHYFLIEHDRRECFINLQCMNEPASECVEDRYTTIATF